MDKEALMRRCAEYFDYVVAEYDPKDNPLLAIELTDPMGIKTGDLVLAFGGTVTGADYGHKTWRIRGRDPILAVYHLIAPYLHGIARENLRLSVRELCRERDTNQGDA